MAIDGTGILESDLAVDVQNEIFILYDANKRDDEIILYIKQERNKLTDPLDIEIFISSCCLSLWTIGVCDEQLYNELHNVAQKGAERFWLENFDKKSFNRRDTELKKLSEKIVKVNPHIRKRYNYKKLNNIFFKKGDVLAINFGSEYGCMIFEDFYQTQRDAYYSFVPVNYKQNEIPAVDELLVEEIPVSKNKDGKIGVRKLSVYFKDVEKLFSHFTAIGTLIIDPESEKSGFSRQVSVTSISGLQKELSDILLGEKSELYVHYTL